MSRGMPVLTKARRAAESRSRSAGKLRRAANAVALAMMCTATTVQAEPIIFNFNCTLVNATTCTPGPQLATMTLSDSTAVRDRVDIDIAISPALGLTSLNRLYLNYGRSIFDVLGRYFSIVRASTVAGSFGNEDGNEVNSDKLGPLGIGMDIAVGLAANATTIALGFPNNTLSFTGSLVIRTEIGPYGEGDLDAAAFETKDHNNLLYAALELATTNGIVYAGAPLVHHPSDVLPIGNINLTPPPEVLPPPDLTQTSGTLIQADVPEPGTLGLLGVAAAFLGSAIGLKKRSRA
jgi:hypothetical protein